MLKRILKASFFLGLLLVLVGAGISWWAYRQLSGSLPQLDGEIEVDGLHAPVTVERDSRGIPTIHATSRIDLAYATGFVHGQDRFFQMDLLRRNSAGELAELIGTPILDQDRRIRLHRFRARAQKKLANEQSDDRQWLGTIEAYTEGVNAGLRSLKKLPFEYLALGVQPQPWKPEDSLLVIYSMFLDLQDDQFESEVMRGILHDSVTPEMFDFLLARGNEWDAPLQGDAFSVPPIPGPDVFDVRKLSRGNDALAKPPKERGRAAQAVPKGIGFQQVAAQYVDPRVILRSRIATQSWGEDGYRYGSNNWAVSGEHTPDGRALLANDMHLGIRVPHIWYRASFVWQDGGPEVEGGSINEHRITGVTLPGAPAMIVGSNGYIAWGFTNTEGDWADAVVVEVDPNDADQYLTSDGPKRFDRHQEIIKVKGSPDDELEVVETIWGPIVQLDHHDRPLALRWVAHDEEGANIGLLKMESIRTLEEALTQANQSGSPHQNFVIADREGKIAWTVMGRIPRRVGHDGWLPRSWADGQARWDGYRNPDEYPRVVAPANGRIWTANARVAGGKDYEIMGDSGYDRGARQMQIRDRLLELNNATEADMLELQLDDRALFLERWQQLLLSVLEKADPSGDREALKKYVIDWGARASIDSVGYRVVWQFRNKVMSQMAELLSRVGQSADPNFTLSFYRRLEGPFWKLIVQRPEHFLHPEFESWDAWLLSASDAVITEATKDGRSLDHYTWGDQNTTRIQHPLSMAVPQLSRWLDMPFQQLPGGWSDMPRIQSPLFGASERMVVSPGKEEDGYMHIPCGQSGHPLSPHYADSHPDWAFGKPSPFLPGPAIHTLTLKP